MVMYFILQVIFQHYFTLLFSLYPLGLWERLPQTLLFAIHLSFSSCLFLFSGLFWTFWQKSTRIILCISCLSPRMSHFSKEPGFILVEKGIKNKIYIVGLFFILYFPPYILNYFLFVCWQYWGLNPVLLLSHIPIPFLYFKIWSR